MNYFHIQKRNNGKKDKFLAVCEGFLTTSHRLLVRSRCHGRGISRS